MVFAGILKFRMSPDVYSYLARLDVEPLEHRGFAARLAGYYYRCAA